MITWYSFINQSKAYVDRFSPKVIVCLEHVLRCSLCSSLCFWIWNPKILYTEIMAWNAKGPRFESWLRLNWLFISWPVANFSPPVAFGTQLAKPMVIPQEHASQHFLYILLLLKFYLSFPKITVTFIHDILGVLWIEFFEVHNWMPGSSFLYSIYWY